MTALIRLIPILVALTMGTTTVSVSGAKPSNLGQEVHAWRSCDAGRSTVTLQPDAGPREVVWELTGALDCQDDGVLNGSTLPGCDTSMLIAEYPSIAKQDRRWDASECVSAYVTENARWYVQHPELLKGVPE